MQRIGSACADALWRPDGFKIFYVDNGAAGTCASFGMDCFNPGDGIAVRREGDLFKGVRGEKRPDDVIKRSGGLWLLRGFEPALDFLL